MVRGCRRRLRDVCSPPPAPDMRTPLEYFFDTQGATVTPNGRILLDTATERDGKIEYSTEDGKRWSVTYSRLADGTYQYGTPEELTPVEATREKTTSEDISNEEQASDEEVP